MRETLISKAVVLLISSLLIWVLPIAAGWFGYASAQSPTTSKQHRESLDEVSQQIEEITAKLNANQKLLKSERDKLVQVEQDIATLRKQQRARSAQIEALQREQQKLARHIDQLLTTQQKDLDALTELIQRRYKQGTINYLQLLMNQQDPYAVGRLNNYYRYFSQAQQDKLEELSKKLTEVREARQQATQISLELQAEQDKLNADAEQLSRLQTQRSERITRLDQTVKDDRSALAKLESDRARLNSLLEQIAAQAARLKQIEQQRAAERAAEKQRNSRQAPTSSPKPKRQPVAGGFKKQRGRLSQPVVGKLDYSYGKRLPESGMRAQGNFYQTAGGQAIKSVFRGNVLFADYLKGYGLLIIVDHGDEHISLYGHNEILYKQVGDAVSTGETIAKSGTSGGLKQPGLYFEIRQNARPVDPSKWLSR